VVATAAGIPCYAGDARSVELAPQNRGSSCDESSSDDCLDHPPGSFCRLTDAEESPTRVNRSPPLERCRVGEVFAGTLVGRTLGETAPNFAHFRRGWLVHPAATERLGIGWIRAIRRPPGLRTLLV
jgi:hypothetical protein